MNFISTAEYHLSQHKPYAKLSTVAHQLSDTEKDVFHTRRQRKQLKQLLLQEIQQYQQDTLPNNQPTTIPFILWKQHSETSAGRTTKNRRSPPTTTTTTCHPPQPNPHYDTDIVYMWKLVWTSIMTHIIRPYYTHLRMTIKNKDNHNKRMENNNSQLHYSSNLVRRSSSSPTEQPSQHHEKPWTSQEQSIVSLAQELSKYNPTTQPLGEWKQHPRPHQSPPLSFSSSSSSRVSSSSIPAIQNGEVIQKISKLDQEIQQQKQLSTPPPPSLQGNWKLEYSTAKEEEEQDFTTYYYHHDMMGRPVRRRRPQQRQRRIVTKLQHIDMEKGTLTNIVNFDPESLKPQNTLVGSRVVYQGKDLSSMKSSSSSSTKNALLVPKEEEEDGNTNSVLQYNNHNNRNHNHEVSSSSSPASLLDLQLHCIMFLFRQPPWWLWKSTQTLSIPIPTKFLKTLVHLVVTVKFKFVRTLFFWTGTTPSPHHVDDSDNHPTTAAVATTNNDIPRTSSSISSSTIQIRYLDDDMEIHQTNHGHWVIQTRV